MSDVLKAASGVVLGLIGTPVVLITLLMWVLLGCCIVGALVEVLATI